MQIKHLLASPLCLLAFAAAAQTATPTPGRSGVAWNRPAASASVAATQVAPALPGDDVANTAKPFKFKEPRKTWEPEPPPPRANDKAVVMGTQRPWMGGKPPVDCTQTPHDPACR